MPRVINKSVNPRTSGVYIGRPSVYGNPFRIGVDGNRDAVIAKYRAWLCDQPDMVAAVKIGLRGRDLVCWCAPLACHGDVLLEIANAPN